MRGSLTMAATLWLLLAPVAQAEEARFQIERSGDGFLRLDRQSGEISRCVERDGQTVCRIAADERSALLSEIDRLESRIDDLDARLEALEAARPAPPGSMPDEEEFEQSLGLMERFIRRFFGFMEELERQFGTDKPAPLPPERT